MKENSELKPVKLRLKIDLVSYPAQAEGLVNMINYIFSSIGSKWQYMYQIAYSLELWFTCIDLLNETYLVISIKTSYFYIKPIILTILKISIPYLGVGVLVV